MFPIGQCPEISNLEDFILLNSIHRVKLFRSFAKLLVAQISEIPFIRYGLIKISKFTHNVTTVYFVSRS